MNDQPTATATPRTDTFYLTWSGSTKSLISFARTLERELSSAQAALAEAKAEVADCRQILHLNSGELDDMAKCITQLRARVTELEADKARLDWLGGSGCLLDFNPNLPDPHWHCTDGEDISATGVTVRAAIDAAKGQP